MAPILVADDDVDIPRARGVQSSPTLGTACGGGVGRRGRDRRRQAGATRPRGSRRGDAGRLRARRDPGVRADPSLADLPVITARAPGPGVRRQRPASAPAGPGRLHPQAVPGPREARLALRALLTRSGTRRSPTSSVFLRGDRGVRGASYPAESRSVAQGASGVSLWDPGRPVARLVSPVIDPARRDKAADDRRAPGVVLSAVRSTHLTHRAAAGGCGQWCDLPGPHRRLSKRRSKGVVGNQLRRREGRPRAGARAAAGKPTSSQVRQFAAGDNGSGCSSCARERAARTGSRGTPRRACRQRAAPGDLTTGAQRVPTLQLPSAARARRRAFRATGCGRRARVPPQGHDPRGGAARDRRLVAGVPVAPAAHLPTASRCSTSRRSLRRMAWVTTEVRAQQTRPKGGAGGRVRPQRVRRRTGARPDGVEGRIRPSYGRWTPPRRLRLQRVPRGCAPA